MIFDDNFIYENIIPINFMSGTGGNFLSNFLQSAKFNVKKIYEFNKSGNAHAIKREREIRNHNHSPEDSLETKIKYIKYENDFGDFFVQNKIPPFFTTIHGNEILELQKYFKKIIHIYYHEDDYSKIAFIFISKWNADNKNESPSEYKTKVLNHVKNLKLYNHFYKEKNDKNVCCISWKDMFVNDPNILIEKLSKFTYIPENNFYIDNLLLWRDKTKHGVYDVFKVKI